MNHLLHSMRKTAGDAQLSYSMQGQLYVSGSGWLLLRVPNNLVRGVFETLNEPGIELPPSGPNEDRLNAHISVMRKEEVDSLGGPDKITERGKSFSYTLGPLRAVVPAGWGEMARVWMLEVRSPALEQLRKSYGLTPLPKNNQFKFHITVAVRRKKVLQNNEVKKTSAALLNGDDYSQLCVNAKQAREDCPHCHAMLERGDDGYCNRCGKAWPEPGFDELPKQAATPIYQRALAAQAHQPIYDPQLGLGGNLVANLASAHARGQRMVDDHRRAEMFAARQDPAYDWQRLRTMLFADQPATRQDPLDDLLFH